MSDGGDPGDETRELSRQKWLLRDCEWLAARSVEAWNAADKAPKLALPLAERSPMRFDDLHAEIDESFAAMTAPIAVECWLGIRVMMADCVARSAALRTRTFNGNPLPAPISQAAREEIERVLRRRFATAGEPGAGPRDKRAGKR